jgi:hypothetical protein
MLAVISAGGFQSGAGRVFQKGNNGTYAGLTPPQKQLADQWFREYNRVSGEKLVPSKEYGKLALSIRSTFEAVTNALMKTKVVDERGRSLGTAIDLINYVELVRGRVPDEGGDKQFRVYVSLKPNALDTLKKSETFGQGRNNSVYHKGYPLNFRSKDGTPSIQISMSRDGLHGDIDVDYRSSSFPASLFNGHLTAGNSDVRAGGNYPRHAERWQGLNPWWERLFGVGTDDPDTLPDENKANLVSIPKKPASKEKKVENAVRDFLNSWLVEKQAANSTAYFSDKSLPCVTQVPTDERKVTNDGLVKVYIYKVLEKSAKALGNRSALADATVSVNLTVDGLKRVEHDNEGRFSLYQVPEDIAYKFDCGNRNSLDKDPKKKMPRRKYGKFYGASFKIKDSGTVSGSNLYLLFAKESGYWKIVSWEVEPDAVEGRKVIDASGKTKPAVETVRKAQAEPALIKESRDFFYSWLIKRDITQAMSYVSKRSDACVDLYSRESASDLVTPGEEHRRISEGLKKFTELVGKKRKLAALIKGVEIHSSDFGIVTHPDESAYTLFAVPSDMASTFECANRLAADDPRGPRVITVGAYFGTSFQVNDPSAPAVLNLLWQKEDGKWKIVSYSVDLG